LYNELLKDSAVGTPVTCPENNPVYHLYVINTPRRDELQTYLKEQGIATGIHYPIPVHLQAAMRSLRYKPGDLPVTEQVVSRILSLPMYAEITDEEITCVVKAIKTFFGAN
jgi:dTDP-4-amino-4,6-dideoxygalactose transaminase